MSSSSFTGNPNTPLQSDYIIPQDPAQRDIKLRQYLNDIAVATNSKDSGLFDRIVSITGQQFLPTFSNTTATNATYRQVFRQVFDTGALPNATTKTIAHGVSSQATYSLVRMYGAATEPGGSSWTSVIPLPFASPTLNKNISLEADATNIIITTAIDYSAWTRSFVIMEWITTI